MDVKQILSMAGVIFVLSLLSYACRKKPMFNADEYFDGPARELAVAIQRNQLDKARQLVGQVDLNQAYRQNMTFLYWAIVNQRKQALELLLKAKASPNYEDANGLSPVAYAATIIDPDYLKILLHYGGDPNSKGDGKPAIIRAALVDENLWTNVVYLLDHGANIDATDARGQTLIMTYAGLENFERAADLIDRGADIFKKKNNGATLALIVQEATPNFGTEPYKWQQVIRKKLINKGITFPVPRPWEERQKQHGKNE